MARTHAKLLCSVWSDPDFLSLSAEAQRMFMLVLSQPKLSFCGVLDYVPARWALLAPRMSEEDIDIIVDELERRRFLVVDRTAHEVLVRTFVKNDGLLQAQWRMTKAMWNAWEAVASPMLKERLVEELPDEAWNRENVTVPGDARALRRAVFHRRQTASAMATPSTAPTPPGPSDPVDIKGVRAQLKAVSQ